ncbi:MAG TPA: YaiO family outer membrane beta-barrel protein [Candidatus Acidoferrum sp.]|nr:YaiO family outer membrane beta-barrel protein [Candidatus Acidoferrum sp.]
MIHLIALIAMCQFLDPPAKTMDVEAGSTSDALTGDRGTWDEQYVSVATRDGPAHAAYADITTDQRFGLSDITYEGGAYIPVAPKLTFDAVASFSPTHQVLPASTLQGGLDLRAGDGYGYQASYTQRNYPSAIAAIATAGADRYRGNAHFSFTLTAVHLSNVPGTAMSAGVAYADYLRCDTVSLAISGGRDVESTGIGANVALYQTISYSANDLHWFTPHTALGFGVGWYLLTGAYDRFELHVALRERL